MIKLNQEKGVKINQGVGQKNLLPTPFISYEAYVYR